MMKRTALGLVTLLIGLESLALVFAGASKVFLLGAALMLLAYQFVLWETLAERDRYRDVSRETQRHCVRDDHFHPVDL